VAGGTRFPTRDSTVRGDCHQPPRMLPDVDPGSANAVSAQAFAFATAGVRNEPRGHMGELNHSAAASYLRRYAKPQVNEAVPGDSRSVRAVARHPVMPRGITDDLEPWLTNQAFDERVWRPRIGPDTECLPRRASRPRTPLRRGRAGNKPLRDRPAWRPLLTPPDVPRGWSRP